MLKVMGMFTLGSIFGLVTLSNFLGYLLKHFKHATNAGIIGFITGSLGVVWPWKEEVFDMDINGEILYDRLGNPILKNYDRFWPHEFSTENILAVFFIALGISIVVALGKYGEKNRLKHA